MIYSPLCYLTGKILERLWQELHQTLVRKESQYSELY